MSAVPIHNPRLRGKKERIRLDGDIADPSNPPSGCYFHPRCRYATEKCSQEDPELKVVNGDAHAASCHYADELNLRGVVAESKV